MPVELVRAADILVAPDSPMIYRPRKRWTRAECDSIEATGLWNRERLELVEGELITKIPKKRPHIVVFMSVVKWFAGWLAPMYLNPEGPIEVSPETIRPANQSLISRFSRRLGPSIWVPILQRTMSGL